jgi:hypothetical protein
VDVTEFTVAAAPPKETLVSPGTKFVPVIVTDWPPAEGPAEGAMEEIVGASWNW